MEPEDSLPLSQEPSTVPYPDPDDLNPYHHFPRTTQTPSILFRTILDTNNA
jgi:hypothetical protein